LVAGHSDLDAAYQELLKMATGVEDLIVQKYIPGTLFDACVVAREGAIAGMVTQARTLMYPISGSVGAILATVDYPDLTKAAEYVVIALNWTGPVQMEFKRDPFERAYSLIEINPRFWGTTGA